MNLSIIYLTDSFKIIGVSFRRLRPPHTSSRVSHLRKVAIVILTVIPCEVKITDITLLVCNVLVTFLFFNEADLLTYVTDKCDLWRDAYVTATLCYLI